jgi:hypothetical protein
LRHVTVNGGGIIRRVSMNKFSRKPERACTKRVLRFLSVQKYFIFVPYDKHSIRSFSISIAGFPFFLAPALHPDLFSEK